MDIVRLWLLRADPSQSTVELLAGLLDDSERGRVAGLRLARDRRQFTVVHACTRLIVAAYLGVPPRTVRWRPGGGGKPELADPTSGLRVNLSHSGDLGLIALAPWRAVGVDVEQLLPASDAVAMAARYFTGAEAAYVAAGRGAGNRGACFAQLWVRKEALVKAYGGRLSEGLSVAVGGAGPVVVEAPGRDQLSSAGRSLVRIRDVPAPPGFRAAVALTGAQPYRVELHRWRWARGGTPPGVGRADRIAKDTIRR
jgi:4'-phosphopantetheinyl transferase